MAWLVLKHQFCSIYFVILCLQLQLAAGRCPMAPVDEHKILLPDSPFPSISQPVRNSEQPQQPSVPCKPPKWAVNQILPHGSAVTCIKEALDC